MAGSRRELKIFLEWMEPCDMPEVLAIERSCFEFPWTENDFSKCLDKKNMRGIVAEYEGKVVGFIVYKRDRRDVNILSIAVHPKYRRNGFGRQLLADRISQLSRKRQRKIILQVRESNLSAQLFLRNFNGEGVGFRAVFPVLRGFYKTAEGKWEDAYQMEYCPFQEVEEKTPTWHGQNRISSYLTKRWK